jgi:hypothetical protein
MYGQQPGYGQPPPGYVQQPQYGQPQQPQYAQARCGGARRFKPLLTRARSRPQQQPVYGQQQPQYAPQQPMYAPQQPQYAPQQPQYAPQQPQFYPPAPQQQPVYAQQPQYAAQPVHQPMAAAPAPLDAQSFATLAFLAQTPGTSARTLWGFAR